MEEVEEKFPVTPRTDLLSLIVQIEKWSSKNSQPSMQLWVRYTQANIYRTVKPLKSCQLFSELSRNTHFPLSDLAHWRAQEICFSSPSHFVKGKLSSVAPEEVLGAVSLGGMTLDIIDIVLPNSFGSSEWIEELVRRKNQRQQGGWGKNRRGKNKGFDHLDVAGDFLKSRQFDSSLSYYKKVIYGNFSITQKVVALRGVRRLYKLKRDKSLYLKASLHLSEFVKKQFLKFKKTTFSNLYFETHLDLAKDYWTQNRLAAARKILKALPLVLGKTYSMMEVYWIRGRMHEEKGNLEAALWWYNQALKEGVRFNSRKGTRFNSQDLLMERILWYKAWSFFKLHRYIEATELLHSMIQTTASPYRSYRYKYWLGRAHQKIQEQGEQRELGNQSLSVQIFKELAQEDPMGFYGLLAHRELQWPIRWPQISFSSTSLTSSSATSSLKGLFSQGGLQYEYLKWLLAVSENQIAKAYLVSVQKGPFFVL